MPPELKILGIQFLSCPSVGLSVWQKNFKIGHNFWMVSDRTFIFHMRIPCDKTFPLIPKYVTLTFDLLFKNFNIWRNLNGMW